MLLVVVEMLRHFAQLLVALFTHGVMATMENWAEEAMKVHTHILASANTLIERSQLDVEC